MASVFGSNSTSTSTTKNTKKKNTQRGGGGVFRDVPKYVAPAKPLWDVDKAAAAHGKRQKSDEAETKVLYKDVNGNPVYAKTKDILTVHKDDSGIEKLGKGIVNAAGKGLTALSRVNDVAGAKMRQTVFGDNSSYANGNKPTTGNKAVDTVANVAGTLEGLVMPTGGTGSVVGGIRSGAELVGSKVIPKATTKAAKLGKAAITGAIESVPYTAQQVATQKDIKTGKDVAKTAALNIGLGAASEVAILGLGKVGSSILTKLKDKKALHISEVKEISNLPEATQAEIINNADEVTKRRYRLNKTLSTAKNETDKKGYTIDEYNQLAEELKAEKDSLIDNQVEYLKNTQKKGVIQGSLIKDADGNVTGRTGRISKNELWYQDFHKANGRTPNKAELREIAEKQLSEGFDTTNGSVPADDYFKAINDKLYEAENNINAGMPQKKYTQVQADTGAMQATKTAKGIQTNPFDTTAKNVTQSYKYTIDTLPENHIELQRLISKMESDQYKGIKIDLQLFAEAKKKLQETSKFYTNTMKHTEYIPEDAKEFLDESDFRYGVLTEAEQVKQARNRIATDAESEMRKIQDLSRKDYNEGDINIGMELLHDLADGKKAADFTPDDILNVRKLAKGVSQAGRTQGRGIQAFAKYSRTTEGVITATQKITDKVYDGIRKTNTNLWKKVEAEADEIVKAAKAAGNNIDHEVALSKVKKKHGIPDLTDNDIKQIAEYMETVKNTASDSREHKEAWAKVMKVMGSKIPPTFIDKFRGLQRISYLLNPKTILVRNPLGNVILGMAENIKDAPGAIIDMGVSKVTGKRTTLMPSIGELKTQFKGAGEGLSEALKDIKAGVDTSPTVGRLEMPKREVFNNGWVVGKALNKMDNMVGNLLQLGDRPFYTAAYNERLTELMKINKVKEATQEMLDEAHDFALEKVFQNDTPLSDLFKQMKTPPANASAGVKAAWGFIGNTILPFSKTPANVLNKLLEYSPVGLAKAIGHAGLSKGGKTVFNQKYFVDNIARGLTGTGLAVLGYTLANKGIVKGASDKDKDVAAVEQLLGINSYSFVIDGKSYTFDWASPIGSTLAAGADAYYAGMNKGTFAEKAAAGLGAYGNTFFKQSMVKNIMEVFANNNPMMGIAKSVLDNTNLASPTIAAQTARTIDPFVRDTKSDSWVGEQTNKLIARTPIASTLLPKSVDVMGNDKKYSQGRNVLARGFEQFLSPGFYGDTEAANKTLQSVYKVYQATSDKTIFPRIAPDTFKFEGKVIKVTQEQKRQWQKLSGKYYSQRAGYKLNAVTSKKRAELLKDLADESYNYAKAKLFPKYK